MWHKRSQKLWLETERAVPVHSIHSNLDVQPDLFAVAFHLFAFSVYKLPYRVYNGLICYTTLM